MNKIEVHEWGYRDYGMIATESISEGDLLAYIPREMIITTKSGTEKSQTFKNLKENGVLDQLQDRKRMDFYVYLLEELDNPASPWQTFLRSLIIDAESLPDAFSQLELTWLKGTSIYTKANNNEETLMADSELITATIPGFDK